MTRNLKKEKERKQEIVALRNQLKKFSKENAYLRKKVESLQCWTSYENPQSFSDEDYRELYECNFTEKLSEENLFLMRITGNFMNAILPKNYQKKKLLK